jgi:hypothetical protein
MQGGGGGGGPPPPPRNPPPPPQEFPPSPSLGKNGKNGPSMLGKGQGGRGSSTLRSELDGLNEPRPRQGREARALPPKLVRTQGRKGMHGALLHAMGFDCGEPAGRRNDAEMQWRACGSSGEPPQCTPAAALTSIPVFKAVLQ